GCGVRTGFGEVAAERAAGLDAPPLEQGRARLDPGCAALRRFARHAEGPRELEKVERDLQGRFHGAPILPFSSSRQIKEVILSRVLRQNDFFDLSRGVPFNEGECLWPSIWTAAASSPLPALWPDSPGAAGLPPPRRSRRTSSSAPSPTTSAPRG